MDIGCIDFNMIFTSSSFEGGYVKFSADCGHVLRPVAYRKDRGRGTGSGVIAGVRKCGSTVVRPMVVQIQKDQIIYVIRHDYDYF